MFVWFDLKFYVPVNSYVHVKTQDGSFEHPKNKFRLVDKKIIAILLSVFLLRPNKKIPVFRVTQPYETLNFFQVFLELFFIILCILKGISSFKMHKKNFFPEKKLLKKICVPSLPKIFRPVTRYPKHTYFLFGFIWTYDLRCGPYNKALSPVQYLVDMSAWI